MIPVIFPDMHLHRAFGQADDDFDFSLIDYKAFFRSDQMAPDDGDAGDYGRFNVCHRSGSRL